MHPPGEASPLAHTTRTRLFAALQGLRRAATTREVADAVGMHPNGVRRHLEQMTQTGLLERRRVSHGRGRPRDEWSIAPGARPGGAAPEAYDELALWLARAVPAGPANVRRVERVGREVGLEMAPTVGDDLADVLRNAFSALGFEPSVRANGQTVRCTLGNCPYRDSARENPDLVCGLHRGLTQGLLERVDPDARLTRFEPRDPVRAGCIVEVATSA